MLILCIKINKEISLLNTLLFNLRTNQLADSHLIKRLFIASLADREIAEYTRGNYRFSFSESRVLAEIIKYIQEEEQSRVSSGLYRTKRVNNLDQLKNQSFRPDLRGAYDDEGVQHDRDGLRGGAVGGLPRRDGRDGKTFVAFEIGGAGNVPYLAEESFPIPSSSSSCFQPITASGARGKPGNELGNSFQLLPLPVLRPRVTADGGQVVDGLHSNRSSDSFRSLPSPK